MAKKTSNKKLKKKPAVSRGQSNEEIIIDEKKSLVFKSEEELYKHFETEIKLLESEFYKHYQKDKDVDEATFDEYEDLLLDTLSEPDEIYQSAYLPQHDAFHYIKAFQSEDGEEELYYVAVVYKVDDVPTFVFMHFPTKSKELLEHFSSGNKVFDHIEEMETADALSEGDELAVGLYQSMLKLRSEKDIPESEFKAYKKYRDEAIEEPDEIWRDPDLQGNVLVSFIKDFSEGSTELYYVAVAVEDKNSDSHLLLFSFPTNDKFLAERYKHGENLHAEEIIQSDAH